jgi:hypothetical protein
MINLGVDIGRSSVKVMGNAGYFSFPFLIANKKSEFSDYIFMKQEDLQWATYNKEEVIFGETARLAGEIVFQNTEGKFFHEIAMKLTVIAIAWYMKKFQADEEVMLGFNLTFENMFMKKDYIDFLKKKHKVVFFDKTEFVFSVEKVCPFYQGFSGLFDQAMTDSLKLKIDFYKTQGIVCDFGRLTLNCIYVDNMQVRSGSTQDYGIFKFYDHLIEQLKKRWSIVKNYYELEDIIRNQKVIPQMEGEDIDISSLLQEVSEMYFPDIDRLFMQFLSKYTPSYLFLLGGGAYFIGDLFKNKYKKAIVALEPEWSNSRGMLKFLNRINPEVK